MSLQVVLLAILSLTHFSKIYLQKRLYNYSVCIGIEKGTTVNVVPFLYILFEVITVAISNMKVYSFMSNRNSVGCGHESK